jgi:putative alpha-1,2-mannosidase
LIGLVGGREAFIGKLDTLFAKGYYDHGNEPNHHLAYLYDNAGAAWKTQEHLRSLTESQYADRPTGLAGNTTAARCRPGTCSVRWASIQSRLARRLIRSAHPLFDDAVLQFAEGKRFHSRAVGASAGKRYIRSATLNGVPLTRF